MYGCNMSKNIRLLFILIIVALGMFGVSYAFVPLYRIFCQVFGIPVPTIMVGKEGAPKTVTEISDRVVTVRFIANTAKGKFSKGIKTELPVRLWPVTKKVKVRLGEPVLTAYKAKNISDNSMKGVAIHTIIALGGSFRVDINEYVDLQQCFCFESQLYPANTEVILPLSFTITPDLPKGIHTVTFGYTLYEEESAL